MEEREFYDTERDPMQWTNFASLKEPESSQKSRLAALFPASFARTVPGNWCWLVLAKWWFAMRLWGTISMDPGRDATWEGDLLPKPLYRREHCPECADTVNSR